MMRMLYERDLLGFFTFVESLGPWVTSWTYTRYICKLSKRDIHRTQSLTSEPNFVYILHYKKLDRFGICVRYLWVIRRQLCECQTPYESSSYCL